MQLLACFAGGSIALGRAVEYGYLPIRVRDRSGLLRDLPEQRIVFHDHTDADGSAARVRGARVERRLRGSGLCRPGSALVGTQFHPEESSEEHPAGARP